MPAGLSYNPLSIMFINVPSISKLQWHPFTITSNSNLEPEKISIVVKGEGSWSKKLNQMLSSPSSPDRLEVSVEGPYGPVSTDFLRFARKENPCLFIHSSFMMFQTLVNDLFLHAALTLWWWWVEAVALLHSYLSFESSYFWAQRLIAVLQKWN